LVIFISFNIVSSGCKTECKTENGVILMLGDSITAYVNWNLLLNNEKVVNLGIILDTTSSVLIRLEDVYQLKPETCFIMIGINDFQVNMSVEYVMENYRKIVTKIKNHHIKVIIQSVLYLGKNYYINHTYGHDKTDWEEINGKVKRLNVLLEKMAEELDVEFVDLNAILSSNNILLEEYEDYQGLHLNILGVKKWAEKIEQIIYR